ncbi:TniQ family protein [Paraburkholderia adhaesiva]|uniref:TniQ family protein n=1 Tax=Paraburkholderia adhaesiva TaxID=2883244 RepID=UPI001F2A8430|nr:TniQ family protein [Paraburkholderia adhaesiva]
MNEDRLWPAHPHPYRGELLSSWLVRVAHANGLKVQTFCRLAFGNDRQVWNRDIDRLAPASLVETMSARTGTPLSRAWRTTLMIYRGKLFKDWKASGQLQWVLSLKMFHRKRLGYGLQFCPRCLAEDAEPYFRLAWRVAFYTYCPKHDCMLLDRCPQCGQGVAYHRIELGRPDVTSTEPLCRCWACGYDYRESGTTIADKWNERTFECWTKALRITDCDAPSSAHFDYGKLAVLHQMVKLLTSDEKNRRLARYVASKTGQAVPNAAANRVPIEGCGLAERHHVVGLAWWLIDRWPSRLKAAWRRRALRYNWLLRDFNHAPNWYRVFANSLSCHLTRPQERVSHDT